MFSCECYEIFKNTYYEKWHVYKEKSKENAWKSKYQVENCPILPGRNLISTCNRRVKSISDARVQFLSRQAGIM